MERHHISDIIYRRDDIIKIDNKLKLFGINRKLSTTTFLNMKFITILLVFILSFLSFSNGFIIAPILAVISNYAFTYIIIDRPLQLRSRKLEHEAFYFFEVLTLSLESGRNLEQAIETACTYIDSEIASEFRETIYQTKFGKSLSDALDQMRKRIPSDTINNILLNIIQSNIFGNSIIDTLYTQIDFLRDKRIMEIKAEISRIPTKISIFSVLFFVPLILMLIIAPLVIEYMSNL